jgi:hypothetical protein
MPGVQAPVYVRHGGSGSKAGFVLLRRDHRHSELLEENARLAVENARLAEENSALREAADLWIRLYEAQLERANKAARQEP